MSELKARDIMSRKVIALDLEQTVTEAAKVLSKNKISGAPVLDAEGKLVGMLSESDLIVQDVKLHFPTYIQLLDSYIYLGSLAKFEAQLKKAVAAKVKDLMTAPAVSVDPETTVEDVATLMVDKDIGRLPVVKEWLVVGIITKRDIVKSLSRE